MGRLDLRNELWDIFVTSLGEVDFVSHPERGAFPARARIQIVGGS